MSRSNELMQKAVELQKLLVEVKNLAEEHNYGIQIDTYSNTLDFDDWMSSSCYGEGDEGFGVSADGSLWQSSSC
ncbi:hypothetical protein MYO4S_00242 [Serratia phage 4S]|nr:hypothetical protein MYO4S_00242 [Serratia phage 4S]